jgi:hypothetical protein
VIDEVALTVARDASPGSYTLLLGFYPYDGGARVPVIDATGQLMADSVLRLSDLTVLAAGDTAEDDPRPDPGSP